MNKFFSASILAGLLLLLSCQDKSVTSKLQGKWQLKTIEQEGNITSIDTVWYNFESESLFMYQIYWAKKDSFMYRYGYRVQTGNSVMELEMADDNPEVPLSRFLPYTDWKTAVRIFTIEKNSEKHLQLRSNDIIYSFTKHE